MRWRVTQVHKLDSLTRVAPPGWLRWWAQWVELTSVVVVSLCPTPHVVVGSFQVVLLMVLIAPIMFLEMTIMMMTYIALDHVFFLLKKLNLPTFFSDSRSCR